MTTDVVAALAAARGVAPVELDLRLHDHVDPEALAGVVDSLETGQVTFTVDDHEVRVGADGSVTVDG